VACPTRVLYSLFWCAQWRQEFAIL
jgi:hypothetical protein